MKTTAISASPPRRPWSRLALALAAALALGASGCDSAEPTTPTAEQPRHRLTPQAGAQLAVAEGSAAARGKSGRHVTVPRRKIPKFQTQGQTLGGAAATAERKKRLRAAIASGEARGSKHRMRASDGREYEVSADELLALLERHDAGNTPSDGGKLPTSFFRPAAFQSDTGILSIAGMSTAYAYPGSFDFYTTSIPSTTNVNEKYMESVRHDATRQVALPNGVVVVSVRSQDQGSVNRNASYDIYNTVWENISAGQACAYDGTIGSQHQVHGKKWVAFHTLLQPIDASTSSAGAAFLRRPCHEKPVSLCDDPSSCDLNGDGRGGESPRSVGGEVEWEANPPEMGGGRLVCMVTDWYDDNGNYLDTSIDYCWIEY